MPFLTPDIDMPLAVDAATGEFLEVEQDSILDYVAKAEVLVRYREGDRSELPEFGSPELLGHIVPLDLSELRAAFTTWIPEANYRITETGEPGDDVWRRISIEVDEPSIEE